MLEKFIPPDPRKGSVQALNRIAQTFPLVFLQTGFWGSGLTKAWLKGHHFPEWPLIPWSGGAVFQELVRKGLKIEAVIGSPEVVATATEYTPHCFSFKPTEKGTEVKTWDEIAEQIGKRWF